MVYSVERNGEVVTFPPMGGAEAGTVSFTSFGDGEPQLAKFAFAMFESVPAGETRISVPIALIPRPDNAYDAEAVSVAAPKSMGGDKDARHLGFLYRSFIGKLGDQAIPRLAALSGGEIRCTAVIERDECTDYNRLDPNDPADLRYNYTDIHLDLPRAQELCCHPRGIGEQTDFRNTMRYPLRFIRTFRPCPTSVQNGGRSAYEVRVGD
jgi:hypothetical protein